MTYGSKVLILYDYLLTFDAEVKYFWSTKVTGAIVLFVANRYLSLVALCWLVMIETDIISLTAKVLIYLR